MPLVRPRARRDAVRRELPIYNMVARTHIVDQNRPFRRTRAASARTRSASSEHSSSDDGSSPCTVFRATSRPAGMRTSTKCVDPCTLRTRSSDVARPPPEKRGRAQQPTAQAGAVFVSIGMVPRAQVVVRQLFWLEIREVRVRAAVRREDAGLELRPGEDVA